MKTTLDISSGILFIKKRKIGKWTPTFALILMVFFTIISSQQSFSQGVGISEVSITPDASSILELRSTLRGFLAPRMTTGQRDAIGAPAQGLLIFNTSTNLFNYYDGAWKVILNTGTGVTSVTGTSNRISVTGTTAPVIDIDANYIGQASITTLGTIGTGTWNGSTISVSRGGTGQTTQQLALNSLAGGVTSGQYLRGDGTNILLSGIQVGDVPTLNQNTTGSAAKWTTARNLAGNSVDGSANVPFTNKFIIQGTVDAGLPGAQFLGALGTGLVKNTTATGVLSIGTAGTDYSIGTSALTTGILKSTTGTGALSIAVAGDFPTLNQNTTGTASNVTGTVAIANGGTGQTTSQTAINALAGGVTSGQYLRGNGTNILLSGIQAGDVPTLNQNTTGTASNVTGIVAIINGGTGSSTQNFVDLTTGQTAAGAKIWSNAATFNAGLSSTGGAVNLNTSSNFNTNINTGTSTGVVNIGSTTGAAGIVQRVGTGDFNLDGVATSDYGIGASTTTGTVTIGGTAQTGTMNLGVSTGAETVNLATGVSGIKTVHIADGNTANLVTIGSTAGVASTTINAGTGGVTIANGLKGSGATPTGIMGPGANNGGTAAIQAIEGTNLGGKITITTSSGAPIIGVVTTIAFANGLSFPLGCSVQLQAGNNNTAALNGSTKPYVSTTSSTGFVISSINNALNSSTQYVWYYQVVGY